MIYILALAVTINGLTITNVTSPVRLDPLLTKGYENIPFIAQTLMTNYKTADSQDPSVFYLMSFQSNDSEIGNHVVGDVFDSNFRESTNINNLPLDIDDDSLNTSNSNGYAFTELYANGVCTSPVTNDIITCWINITVSFAIVNYQIGCRIYFVATNTFSDTIFVTNTTLGQSINNAQRGVVCFDDSYFIPYGYTNVRFSETDIIYATLLDLKGNIKYKEVELKNISIPRTELDLIYGTKGSKQFNAKSINSAATDLFTVTFALYNTTDNTTTTNGLFGYYTNISDPNFPITIYNDTIVQRATDVIFTGEGYVQPLVGITTELASDCCYIFAYEVYQYTQQSGDVDDVYLMITDIHGNNIDIAGLSNNEDFLAISNISDSYIDSIVDLPSISSGNARYFMLSYSNNTMYDNANVTAVRIFYLEKQGNTYQLNSAGDYAITNIQGDIPPQSYPSFDNVFVYNPPGTSLLMYTWVQEQQMVVNGTYSYPQQIRGQTFEIK